jgi:ABC-2 type transport system permease protein
VSFAAFAIGQGIFSGKTPTASLSDSSAVRAVIGGGLYLVALGLLALGLATIIRHTAASISAFVGSLFVKVGGDRHARIVGHDGDRSPRRWH